MIVPLAPPPSDRKPAAAMLPDESATMSDVMTRHQRLAAGHGFWGAH